MKKFVLLLVILLTMGFSTVSATTMDWAFSHTYPADEIITLGVGDISNPDWSTVIQSHQWIRSGSYVFTSEAETHLYDNTWWLNFHDTYYWDSGQVTRFDITDNYGTTFSSSDVPMSLPDLSNQYVYINTPVDPSSVAPVPEPATMLLFGTGLAGLVGFKRKKAAGNQKKLILFLVQLRARCFLVLFCFLDKISINSYTKLRIIFI